MHAAIGLNVYDMPKTESMEEYSSVAWRPSEDAAGPERKAF
jgi:hypothetical protein